MMGSSIVSSAAPPDWVLEPLSRSVVSACDGPFGSHLKSAHYSDAGARVVRLGNIGEGVFKDADRAFIPTDYFSRLRRHEVLAGDLLVAGLGDERHPLGRACVAPESLGQAIVKADCFRFRLDTDRFHHPFVAWFLSSLVGASAVAMSSRGATRSRANLRGVASTQVLRPPLPVQRAVAQFCDLESQRVTALIDRATRLLELLEERRVAVYHAAVTGTLAGTGAIRRPADLAWADTLPDDWSATKLTHVARLGSGHTPSRSRPELWEHCTIPWITTGEVAQVRGDRRELITETRELISQLGVEKSAAEVHPAGTVVLSRTASAGYSAIMGKDMATSQDFAAWTCSDRLLPRWLLFCLRAMRPDLLGRLAMGSTHKTIYMPDIQSLRVPLPPVRVQRMVLETADREFAAIDPLTDALRRQMELLAEHRQALITAAVTGQIDVTSYRAGAEVAV